MLGVVEFSGCTIPSFYKEIAFVVKVRASISNPWEIPRMQNCTGIITTIVVRRAETRHNLSSGL